MTQLSEPVATIDVRVSGLRKHYGAVAAVDGVDIEIARGEFFTMLGPSGSGKTTTLRMIAGFERPDAGSIELGGRDVSALPPFDRDVNTVFQDYALFPHMTVRENVEYGLRVKRVSKQEWRMKAEDALRMVRLEGYGGRKPGQLSGGQRQRVALARAIVNTPRALLLDEPLGALDLKLRQELQLELKQIQQKLGMTFVYVTHDQEEALTMSDRIAVFNQGKIEQIGRPAEMYEHPATTFVAGFIGTSNILIMAVYAFNSSNIQSWPIPGFTTKWFHEAWNDDEVRTALWLSLRAALLATAVALVLGSLAAFGLARSRFFGRDSISFLFVLPIALPGIITGLALNSFFVLWGVSFSLWTIVIGHATFCVVVVYNNVLARLRRTSGSFFEASADLGATGFQTFRFVTLPVIGTALIAGALLAFALSWDEIVVTYFTAGAQNTLPLLLFGFIRQGQNLPIVNAIALVVIVVSAIPVYVAQRLTSGRGEGR